MIKRNRSIIASFLHKPYLYLIVILVGTGLKFYRLENNFFWDDEVATILHTSGITMAEYERNLPVNEIVPMSHYTDLLKLNDKDFGIFEQITGLAKMPQLTPGHYYYLIFWTRIFGDGHMSFRYFSVMVFILSLPFLWLLARRIFNSSSAAWFVVAIYSVSPYFHNYTQAARYYILWSLALVILHYVLLIAAEKPSLRNWIIYTVVGSMAVHISILFYIILAAHLAWFLLFYGRRWLPLMTSLSAVFLSSLPWLIFIYLNRADIQENLSWHTIAFFGEKSVFGLVGEQIKNIPTALASFSMLNLPDSFQSIARWLLGGILITTLFIFFRSLGKKEAWFVSLITFSAMLAFLLLDIIRNSYTSLFSRYHLMVYVGIILIAGYSLSWILEKKPLLSLLLFFALTIPGMVTSIKISDNPCYSKRGDCKYYMKDAVDLFSGEEKILVISDYQVINRYSYTAFMSQLLICENQNIDILYSKPSYPDFRAMAVSKPYEHIYAMYLSDELQEGLQADFSEDEMVIIEDRMIHGFNLPLFEIRPAADTTQAQSLL